MRPHPTKEYLRRILDYDPLTGLLKWKRRSPDMFRSDGTHSQDHACKTWNSRYADKPAFASKNGHGYFQGSIHKRKYEAHRVIYAWMTGEWPPTVDHEDGILENNKWSNLVAKSRMGNQRNLGLRKNNTSGVNGVVRQPNGTFRAMIMMNRKCKTLGVFHTIEAAAACRAAANIKYGFHPNHGQRKSTASRKLEAAE